MGKLPKKALDKFADANRHFKSADDDPFEPGLPPPLPRVSLKEIKRELILLDARVRRIAQGLADLKEAIELSLVEVKKELNEIEEQLPKARARPRRVG